MRKPLLALCGLLLSTGVFAQTANLGGPISWKGKLPSHVNIPEHNMPGFDMEQHRIEDSINDIYKAAPWNFGHKYETDITLANSGVWTDLPNGNRLWRTAITCDGAQTINLIFENLYIPDGAHIYLSDVDQTNRVGAYTSRNNREDGLLGTELVHGDEIIVEYYEPNTAIGQGHFTIANVTHGYRSNKAHQMEFFKALNSSGDCNVDVNCPLGVGWEDQIRSVAMIVVNGSGYCSGTLMNNSCDDGTPYFLTANHCLSGGAGAFAFRWNWQSPPGTESCATTANSVDPGPPYDQTSNGATILVSGTQADHGLLQIDNMTLGDAQTWNLFYAGWNNDDTDGLITEATGIHHPSGDVKKICREDNTLNHDVWSGAQCWQVNDWDQGVTEGGSSGSALFDQNGRVIGQLYGGGAACQGTNDNGSWDVYGRLGVSWGLGIDAYLDPASCDGSAITNDGWDPNSPSLLDDAGITSVVNPTGTFCVDNFIPEVVLRNYGANSLTTVTINYDIDGGPNNTFTWNGSLAPGGSENVTLPSMTTAGGAHTFNAYTTLPNGNADSDPGNDASSSTYTATLGGLPVDLSISTDCWGYETYWEIVDAGMTVVATGGNTVGIPPGGTNAASGGGDPGAYGDEITVVETLCLSPGCYDFVIYDDYGDGMTDPSCATTGSYEISDASGILASIIDVAFGNSETNNFCVASPCNSTFDYTTVEEDCFGDDDGSVTVVFLTGNSSGATYDIGTGAQASGTFTGLAQGSYSVTVVDGDACTSIVQVTLGGPTQLTATASATDVSCSGQMDGEVTVNATGGTPTYSYDFGSGAQGSNTATGLGEGVQSVTVADANGCSVVVSATIGAPAALTGVLTGVTHETNGNDGAINITTSGGGNISYSWTGPNGYTSSVEDPSGLDSGLYTVVITDDCGGSVTIADIEVLDNTGLEEGEILDFVIYPNPSHGLFSIEFNGIGGETYTVAVTDIAGRVVFHKAGSTNMFDVNIANVADGTYMLTITSDVLNARKTIVIKK